MNIRVLVATILICTSCSVWPDSNRWIELLTEVAAMGDEARVPAMGLVIMDDNQPAVVKVWGENVTTATPFRWGSISKTFTALALLRLVALHQVELDDEVRLHLPRGVYQNPWSETHPILLKHLVELTAGFSDLSGSEFNQNQPLTLTQALALNPASRVTHWPPGLQHNYSNLTPGLTSVVIEHVSGLGFEEFMKQQVLLPLAMANASFQPVAGLPGGFKVDGLTEIPYWHMTFRAFGALNASVAEMSNFLSVLLNNGVLNDNQVLDRSTVTALYHPQTSLGVAAGLEVAYAAGMYGWVSKGHVFQGHGGDADGYRSRYGLLPDSGRGYLIVINTDNPLLLRSLQKQIEAQLTTDLEKPVPLPAVTVAPEQLARYTGTYYPAAARFGVNRWQSGELAKIRISLQAEELLFSRGRRQVRLLPLGDGRFRRQDDPLTTVIFVRDANGVLFIQGELGNFVKMNSPPCPAFINVCDSQ
ncbi:MAG: beta-lactamase family protein [Proteobacteria bacterium]|nr:beta-lactamase family protein [Pseudomonadota bacterium]